MRKIIRSIVLVASLCTFLLLNAKDDSFAQSTQFTTSYNVSYEINNDGGSNVVNTITIKNNTAEYYVADFTLKIPDSGIENIKANRSNKQLKTKTTQKDNEIELNVEFDQPAIGINKSTTFQVSYTAKTVARLNGTTLDVNIPGISKDYQGVYNVEVKVPSEKVTDYARIFPAPNATKESDNQTVFSYTRDQLKESSILMNFGDNQFYEMDLTYFIKNPTNKRVRTEVALPPNTEYQKVIYQDITPKPENIEIDDDGNYMAQYLLEGEEEFEIQVHAYVKVENKLTTKYPELTPEQIQIYTQNQEYWEVDDQSIINQATQLTTIEDIYNYTVKALSYDKSKLNSADFERLGAKKILENPNDAVCMEFTDLFIALARAKGIPARELNGYAFTNDKESRPLSLSQDILHAWPEYYDLEKKQWIPVDPTWGNTTGGMNYFSQFDTNHIVFVRKGVSSTYPYPAGAYKRDNSSTNVFVNIATDVVSENNTATIKLTGNSWKLAGVTSAINPTIINEGNSALVGDISVIIKGAQNSKKQSYWVNLPPFSSKELDLSLTPDWNQRETYQVTLIKNSTNEAITSNQKVEVYPIYFHPFILIGAIYMVLLIGLTILFNKILKSRSSGIIKA